MNKNLIALALPAMLLWGCSKSNDQGNGPQNTKPTTYPVKIEIISGSAQSDTIGKQLKSPIIVKVSQNGASVGGFSVQFQASGCNEDNIITATTKSDGTASYQWSLASDVGQQTLRVYAVDSKNQRVDSLSTTATGLATSAGWHYGACTVPSNYLPLSICKISSGRLFTIMGGGPAYLRYSDDNGISWWPLKSLGDTHSFDYVLSTTGNEVFAFAFNEGTFYSEDAGQTWSSLPIQQFNNEHINIASFTASGKLLIATAEHPLYISSDKGKTWTSIPYTAFTPVPPGQVDTFNSPCEDKDGNLYIAGDISQSIYKSTDQGKTWVPISKVTGEVDFAIYIDVNNWFYKSRSDANGGIYLSKDNGVNYIPLINLPNSEIESMSLQSDGNFYYFGVQNGLFRAQGISNSIEKLLGNAANRYTPYLLTNSGNIITNDISNGKIWYYTH